MANVAIKSERLTPFGGVFQSWSNLTPNCPQSLMPLWAEDVPCTVISIAKSSVRSCASTSAVGHA